VDREGGGRRQSRILQEPDHAHREDVQALRDASAARPRSKRNEGVRHRAPPRVQDAPERCRCAGGAGARRTLRATGARLRTPSGVLEDAEAALRRGIWLQAPARRLARHSAHEGRGGALQADGRA